MLLFLLLLEEFALLLTELPDLLTVVLRVVLPVLYEGRVVILGFVYVGVYVRFAEL